MIAFQKDICFSFDQVKNNLSILGSTVSISIFPFRDSFLK